MADAFAKVDAHLDAAIEAFSRWRCDLADPIRCDGQEGLIGQHRQPFATPARQIRHDGVWAEVQFGFTEKEPSAWASSAPIEWTVERHTQLPRRSAVPQARPWRGVQGAAEVSPMT